MDFYEQSSLYNYRLVVLFSLDSYDNIDIILVEAFPCNNKNELESRERYYIENNICLNKNIPTRTMKEWKINNKEHLNLLLTHCLLCYVFIQSIVKLFTCIHKTDFSINFQNLSRAFQTFLHIFF